MENPTETEDLIKMSMLAFEEELAKIPEAEKEGWNQAQEKCNPELIDDHHKLMFLRSECFNAKVGINGLATTAVHRISLFIL